MKVIVLTKSTLEKFIRKKPQSKSSIYEWLGKIQNADWVRPTDIAATFNSADLLGKKKQEDRF